MPHPIRGPFTIPYGAQFGAVRAGGKRTHQGTDYHAPIGSPIYGTGDGGRVAGIGYAPDPWLGLGHYVTITYPNGRVTRDAHMLERTPHAVGTAVGPSTIVGYVGVTGNAVNASPPGSHDHHECRINRVLVDPHKFYGGSATAGSGDYQQIEDDMPLTLAEKQEIAQLAANEAAVQVLSRQVPRRDGSGSDTVAEILASVAERTYNMIVGVNNVSRDLDYINQGAANPASLVKILTAVTGIEVQLTPEQVDRFSEGVDAVLADDFAAVGQMVLTGAVVAQIAESIGARFGLELADVEESLGVIIAEQIASVNKNIDDTVFTVTAS